jgi:CRP-like cAMP-binding protein
MLKAAELDRNLAGGSPYVADSRVPLRLPGDKRDEFILVQSGLLGLYAMNDRGNRLFVGLRFPGEIITPETRGALGIWPLVRSELAPHARAAAVTVAQQLERDLAIAHEWLTLTRTGKTERLAHLLCEIAVRGKTGTYRMPLRLTQEQLADLTGQTNVNANRALAELVQLGLIGRVPHEITFPDWEALCRYSGFNGAYLESAA